MICSVTKSTNSTDGLICFQHSPTFATVFAKMGCPYKGMIGIVVGNFLQMCLPFGNGNSFPNSFGEHALEFNMASNWICTLELQNLDMPNHAAPYLAASPQAY